MPGQRSWIKVGPHGTFGSSGTQTSSAADIDALFAQNLGTPPRLLLHIHGGLVPEAAGLAVADRMMAHYAGTTRSIGLVWETGLLETFRDLTDVTNSRTFKKALAWILDKALGELAGDTGAKGVGRGELPRPEIEARLETDDSVARLDQELIEAVDGDQSGARSKGPGGDTETDAETEKRLEEDLELEGDVADLQDMVDEKADKAAESFEQVIAVDPAMKGGTLMIARFLAKTIVAVLRRYRNGTHHDLLPTAVEELLRAAHLSKIGAIAWSEMKKKAAAMWQDDGPAPGAKGHVGGYLLRKLEALQQRDPSVTIDLVGHSAGSIVICAMLQAIAEQKRNIELRNILFLAPAVRLDTFSQDVVPSGRFQHFRMFTMTDEAEKKDELVGILYPRSLLFLVSGLFEDKPGTPLAGLARHVMVRNPPANDGFDADRRWLAQSNRLVLSPTAGGAGKGLQTRSARHGDFDDDVPTLASLLYLAGKRP